MFLLPGVTEASDTSTQMIEIDFYHLLLHISSFIRLIIAISMDDPAIFDAFLARATTLPNIRSRTAFTTTVAATFTELASTPLDDIKGFIIENSQLNRGRQANQIVTFNLNHSSALQAVAFQLTDRLRYFD